jgi:hypothetical protein
MKLYKKVLSRIEKKVGLSLKEIDSKNPVEISEFFYRKTGKKLSFSSEFPFIGRGNVLRDGLVSNENLNSDIDKILGIK